jgi:uncharacterized protein
VTTSRVEARAPVRQRDLVPDVLRGFALLGIIVVNVAYFSTDVANGLTGEALLTQGDRVAAFLVHALALGKFYLLFSFLFGYATVYALKRGPEGVPRWKGRSRALLLFGALHAVFLFIGDILFIYGVLGLLLAPLLFAEPRRLRRVTWGSYAIGSALLFAMVVLLWLGEQQGADVSTTVTTAYDALVRQGDALAAIPARASLWLQSLPFIALLQGPIAFAAFLVGLRSARVGLLSGRAEGVRVRRWAAWGLGVGLPVQIGFAAAWLANAASSSPLEAVAFGSTVGSIVTAPLLSAGYLAAVVALVRARPVVLGWLASAGRWSLTVYLSQSVVLSLVFSGWGLGLYQRVPYGFVVAIALGVGVGLSALAAVLAPALGKGPMERLLGRVTRTLTFGRSS